MRVDSWIINLLLFSDKRTEFLLLLESGPKTIDYVLDELKVSRNFILPQIKKLKDKGLIVREGEECRLSVMGEILVRKLKPFVDAANVIGLDEFFWENRKLDAIPRSFLGRVEDLKGCCLVELDPAHESDLIPEIVSRFTNPFRVRMFFSFFHPRLPSFSMDLVKKSAEFSLVLNRGVFERFLQDFQKEWEELFKQENVNVFVLEDNAPELPAVVAISESALVLGLFNKWGRFERRYLVSCEPSALKWGEELFTHYTKKARKITSLDPLSVGDLNLL